MLSKIERKIWQKTVKADFAENRTTSYNKRTDLRKDEKRIERTEDDKFD